MDNLKKIGHGEYGIVYKTNINNNEIAIKQFKYKADYYNEKYIYTKLLPIFCGKIHITKLLFINIKCDYIDTFNTYYQLNKYNIISNDIFITDKILIKKIQKILKNYFGEITSINFNINSNLSIIKTTIEDKEYAIGHIIKHINNYHLYIDSFNIVRLLNYDDNNRLLYLEYLGINLSEAFIKYRLDFQQRIYISIDLIRQINYLISMGIYHNDIKCDNIVISQHNDNYYINLIDFGLCKSLKDIKLNDYYLTTCYAYSPEYFKINIKYRKGIRNLTELKDLLDKSTHWTIAGIIINILLWENVQYNIWYKYYYVKLFNHEAIVKKYNNIHLGHKYILDLLNKFISIEELYTDINFMYNIQKIIAEIIDKEFNDLYIIIYIIEKLKTNTSYYKPELVDFILNIFNLLEYETINKKDISTIYNEIKLYPNYLEYVELKNKFI